ncbi:flagellar basal body rod protein FlgC [Haliea atlantica]|jgi:flagellar basal-body rod protein FlgC|nr:flagellar basal body rod protein FlgC [Haliea sp.]|tara:strand:+ start:308691 stop:309098 length:408 start_codon:yes stop_codon:yes gene_type:complete
MSLFATMGVASSALDAQSIRLNTIASNLANANVVSGSAEQVYRARHPVFSAVLSEVDGASRGVRVAGIAESTLPAVREYAPGHPLADPGGFIYRPAIDQVQEMAGMTAAARAFENGVQVIETTKQLALRTLTLGR